MPSIEGIIWSSHSSEDLAIIALNSDAPAITWLQNYVAEKGLTYPFVYDDGSIFNLYQVGNTFQNIPPTYIIIDQNGVVHYRTDGDYNTIGIINDTIGFLLEE